MIGWSSICIIDDWSKIKNKWTKEMLSGQTLG